MTLSSEAAQALANSTVQPQLTREELTEREREILGCLVDGLNNQEIADKLYISLATVKFHVSNIYQKLGVSNRVEAVKTAIEQKIV